MPKYYLAIDIGASSGRHMLGHLSDGKMVLEEVYRFENGLTRINGHLCWNLEKLFSHILQGMKRCSEIGKVPVSVGIDTWAVDFVLLNHEGAVIGDAVGYRDHRTKDMDLEVQKIIKEEALYQRTGIQKQSFNSIYQLMAVQKDRPQDLMQTESMLLIPDYFNYLLTGIQVTEYTNATTTQLVDAKTYNWDFDLIQSLGLPEKIFRKINKPGTTLGQIKKEYEDLIGYTCDVVLPATHDTGSAVMAIPVCNPDENVAYISSGTWSLMGTELMNADCSLQSQSYNFTNEGGYDHRFRYLKNIMGLWMIQSVRKELAPELSYAQICALAEKVKAGSIVDCNDHRFLAPDSMVKEICLACKESNQQVPEGIAEIASVIYHSLAVCYQNCLNEIESETGCHYSSIHIVGGGANADYLNRLTAECTKRKVLAGPTEATAIGNVAAQMISSGELKGLWEARACIRQSFAIKEYGNE